MNSSNGVLPPTKSQRIEEWKLELKVLKKRAKLIPTSFKLPKPPKLPNINSNIKEIALYFSALNVWKNHLLLAEKGVAINYDVDGIFAQEKEEL